MMIAQSAENLIGNTPLVRCKRLEERFSLKAELYAKLESFNPTGSAKDRAALYMVLDAEEKGVLKQGGAIVEPTSGNTGIGLALVCKKRGYPLYIVMPESMSDERKKLLSHYGANLVLTDGKLGMKGAIDKANELLKEIDGAFMPDQFSNPANARAHYETTGPEIYAALPQADIFVACVGTGGTLTGIGKYLKEKNPGCKVVAVEPSASPLLSQGLAGSHKIQGIGANFIPSVLDRSIYDEVLTVADEDAFAMKERLQESEKLFVGISSGAAVVAALQVASRMENAGKTIVTVLPDHGNRYGK